MQFLQMAAVEVIYERALRLRLVTAFAVELLDTIRQGAFGGLWTLNLSSPILSMYPDNPP